MENNKLIAPPEQYRVICLDTFDNKSYVQGDYPNVVVAICTARASAGYMLKTYVYNDQGREISGGFGEN